MKNQHQEYLQAMDIQIWQERAPSQPIPLEISQPQSSSNNWIALREETSHCTKCDLHKSRKNVVFGVGNEQADLMIIGEAPGANEDIQGEPFVGRAGMLLNSILESIGLKRENIFIANILKCRPPNNRDPLPHEVECCTPYLLKQIEHIQPKLIVTVGRIAAQFLLDTAESLSKLRGNTHTYGPLDTPLVVTFHPAYLLRSPKEKARAYIDWTKIQRML